MEQFIQFFGSALLGLIGALTVYFKVRSERNNTKAERDKDSQDLHDTVLKHSFELATMKGLIEQQHNVNEDINKQIIELSKAVAQFSVAVDTLTQAVAELKQDIRDMRKK